MTLGAAWIEAQSAALRRWRRLAVVTLALAAAAAVAALILRMGGGLPRALAGALAAGLLAGLGSVYQLQRRLLGAREVAEHLNRTVPAIEESALLRLADQRGLSQVERLQRHR
ncbi:MAG: hypothetical protein KJZ47_15140, partial [Gemmatimonadales bacterium]|nr:hypothetical protein [Gemmatimonadales bacterium]